MAPPVSLNAVPVAVVAYDGDASVVDANEAALSLLGLSEGDLIGSHAESAAWLVLDSAEGPITVHPVIACLKSGQAVRGVLVRARRPDGADVWLQVDAVPGGEGVTAILTDVTHLISRSRTSSRSSGDHIVDQVTDQLAGARMEPRAILATVTRELSRLRPGEWTATLIGKDPSEMTMVAGNEEEGHYGERYMESMRIAGKRDNFPLSTRVIESGQALVLPDIAMEEYRQQYLSADVRDYLERSPWMAGATHLGVIFVPMRARGAIIGALGHVERRSSNPLTEKDAMWIQAIADRTALAVENAQLYEDAVKRLERLAALQSVSLAVSASPDLRLTLKVILDHVTSQLKVDAADVLLLDEADNTLALSASTGFLATSVPDYRLPAEEGMPGHAVSGRRIETVTALGAFSQFRRRSLFAREGFKAYGAVPLISRGKLLGAIEVFHRSPLTPDQEWVSFLDALGSVAAVAIDSATMQERLRAPRALVSPARTQRPPLDLSRIESEIMRLAVEGLTNREIAARVHLSQNTVKFHIRQILQKTGASNRTELAHETAKQGWL